MDAEFLTKSPLFAATLAGGAFVMGLITLRVLRNRRARFQAVFAEPVYQSLSQMNARAVGRTTASPRELAVMRAAADAAASIRTARFVERFLRVLVVLAAISCVVSFFWARLAPRIVIMVSSVGLLAIEVSLLRRKELFWSGCQFPEAGEDSSADRTIGRERLIDEWRFFEKEGVTKSESRDSLGARASFMKAYGVAREAHYVIGQAETLGQLRQIVHDAESKAAIDQMAAETCALAESLADSDEKAQAYGVLGEYFDEAEDLSAAEDYLLKACRLSASLANGRVEAASWNRLGIVYGKLCLGGDEHAFKKSEEAYLNAEKLNTAMGRVEKAQINRINLEMLYEKRARRSGGT